MARVLSSRGVGSPSKSWQARISEATDSIAQAFVESVSYDWRLYKQDVAGSIDLSDVVVRNLAGHKLPTAYPSRRTWLRVNVRDGEGRLVFSSGDVEPTGAITGNDNDRDAGRFEPHYREIRSGDEVQIYEAIMGTATGQVTTGLLSAVSYLKDNRLLPRGFEKATADDWVKVVGDAAQDADFTGGADKVRYSVAVPGGEGPYQVDVELRFQPISFRWANNLRKYEAPEPKRFVGYYQEMSGVSAVTVAKAER